MKLTKRTQQILLIFLIIFPIPMIFSFLITPVNAGPPIPNEHPNNKWHWGVDVGDTIMYETEVILTNTTSQEIIKMYRSIQIFQISAINNVSDPTGGIYPSYNFSEVLIDVLWENETVGVLSPSFVTPLAYFGFNDSAPVKEVYLGAGIGGMTPIIFPINDTMLDVSLMAPIINTTFLDLFYQIGYTNYFDDYSYDIAKSEIFFENSTDNYYLNCSYYPNNGTIKSLDAYYLMNMGADSVSMNITGKRVFEYSVTDETTWGFNVGDTFYYQMNTTGSGYSLTKYDINEFREEIYWSNTWTMYGKEWPLTFTTVYGDYSEWNGTDWVLKYSNMPFGAGNNFYPYCFPLLEAGGGGLLFSPTSATLDDLKFSLNNNTHLLLEWFPFDIITYTKTDSIVNLDMVSTVGGMELILLYNLTTGLLESQSAFLGGSLGQYTERLEKPIEWAVNPGDIIYFKQNIEDDYRDYRAIINSITGELKNMTILEQEMSMYPIPYTTPINQPELQFFSLVNATFEEWDDMSGAWVTPSASPYDQPWLIMAGANKYWPIYPLVMVQGHPPRIIPKGTVGSDFQNIFDMYASVYNSIIYGNDYVIMRNNTLDRELHFYFDGAEGRVHYLGGWYYMGDWMYMSIYPRYIETLNIGPNDFQIQSDLITDTTATTQIVTSGLGAAYSYAMLSQNPVNESLPSWAGTPLWYFDQLFINWSLIIGNMTMTITFSSSINISKVDLYFFGWDVSGTSEWEQPPQWYYDSMVIYNYATNSIIIENPPIPFSLISAISYVYVSPHSFLLGSTAGKPDDDGDFTLNWDTAIGADSYSVYEYHSRITEINGTLTPRVDHITSLSLPLTGYTNGTYYFIVVAHNEYGDTLSNCHKVDVEIPIEEIEPPGSFTLSSNAGTPDDDGSFTLSWTAADGATSYTVYEYSSYITEINGSLTILAEDVTSLTLALSEYSDGTYYFIVVASNSAGDTLSNCHIVVVDIPGGGGPTIPGYNIYLISLLSLVGTVIIISKKREKLP